jgi:hypothetical protein
MWLKTEVCWPHGSLWFLGIVFGHHDSVDPCQNVGAGANSRAPILSSVRGVAGATDTCEFVSTSIKNKTSLIEFSVLLAIGHYRIEYQSECMQQVRHLTPS